MLASYRACRSDVRTEALYDFVRVSKFNAFKAARDDDALMGPWNPWLHEADIGKAILAIATVWEWRAGAAVHSS